jgi:4,5-dihydroxyphthalate decarboxylase
VIGPDPWEYGLTDRNRHTLETIAGYSHEQGLTARRMPLDELFIGVFQGRKRGDEFRI